jgi:signal transduction histidine kinase
MDTSPVSELESKLTTATKLLQRAEEHASAGQLALEVMHEIRNPLEALGHLVYLTAIEAENPASVKKYMLMAEEQISTLNHIATQTLGFARTSSLPRPIDLVTVAQAALRIHERTIKGKSIRLVKQLPDKLTAEVNPGQLLQVASNLIGNALDALPPHGTLCLRLRKRPGKVQLVIADNGHGIPREHAPRIFQPFFTTKGEYGTGLGLAITKNIIESHQGTIRVRSSDCPGKSGTLDQISLPFPTAA